MPPKTKVARTEDDAAAPRSEHLATERESNKIGADEKYKTGPFSLLYDAVHTPGTQVLILCRNQKRILARVRAFDRHFNMLLENAQEMGTDKDASGNLRQRSLPKLFLRGDGVISVVRISSE
jgi:small nuclear ribonucleoprotein D2